LIDLRITRPGWSRVKDRFAADRAIRRDPSQRDWIELRLDTAADMDRVGGLPAAAMAASA
jgi:hypothetical protein